MLALKRRIPSNHGPALWNVAVFCIALVASSQSCLAQDQLPPAAESEVDFRLDVQPLLMKTCWTCHGPDEQESNFRVDSLQALLAGGDSGEPAIVPGKSAESPLIHRAAGIDGWIMPPEQQGKPLSPTEIGMLRAWIDAGAKMPQGTTSLHTDHWSFQQVSSPAVPGSAVGHSTNPIDAFVTARLRQSGLEFSAPATRRELIQRIYLDMLGLAPTPQEVADFAADDSASAYKDLVDRVLSSPHYGERWARHWLDVVRFSESDGFETNHERPNAYRYRDWVIQALNQDLPYDDFITAQLAGDLHGQDAATGFLVGGPHDIVKSPDPGLTLMQREDELADMINTTSTTFLGLTVGCARCHTHKFDPILQSDYYALGAVFAGVQHGERPLRHTASEEARRARRVEAIDETVLELRQRLGSLEPAPFAGRIVVMDDEDEQFVSLHQEPKGHGVNPAGGNRGNKDDRGDASRFPNISRGRYTWWDNNPGEVAVSYRPNSAGRWRAWISWGCGWPTHSADAEYVLDRDGDPGTTADQTLIAQVDQQHFSDGSGELARQPLWSGFLNAGVFELSEQSAILLQGGSAGTALTADVIVLEEVLTEASEPRALPPIAPPVHSRRNLERFAATSARFVRFTVKATNSVEPCIDELEIWTADTNSQSANSHNVALSEGVVLTSSGDYPGDPKHQLPHINDGQYGNEHSWISSTPGGGWVQIELPETALIDRIVWGRDRNLRFRDRLATEYRIEVSVDGKTWETAADGSKRVPFGSGPDHETAYRLAYAGSMGTPAEELKEIKGAETKLAELSAERTKLIARPMAYAGTFAKPPVTHRLYRGDPMAPQEEIAPDAPQVLDPLVGSMELAVDAPEAQRRAELAKWITSPDNPLTARVIVNRLWHYHFGRGLVATPSDFGAMGAEPTHPELLDWLASELVHPSDGSKPWSLKRIHRLILQSRTYQQSSAPKEDALAIDRDATLLWRFPPRRLEAEAIRDKILQTSGQLDETMYGPGFLLFKPSTNYARNWIAKDEFASGDFRRMIYALDLRMEHDAVFGAFDCPDGGQITPKRSRSTTPIQALNLFNSKFVNQQAKTLANRVSQEVGDDVGAQVQRVFALALQREPDDNEQEDARQLVEQFGLPALCRAMFNSNEFLFLD